MPLVIFFAVGLLFFAAQSVLYKRLWSKNLTYNAWFSAKEAFEGDRVFLAEEISNRKFLPLPWLHAKTAIPHGLTVFGDDGAPLTKKGAGSSLYSVRRYTAIRKLHPIKCRKRGVYSLRYTRLSAADLMHTAQYFADIRTTDELLVFPRTLENSRNIDLLYNFLDAAILTNRLINPDPFEFRGIRDYLPTDALKTVNFKASAVAQKLMVNVHAPTSARRIALVLNLDGAFGCEPAIYEQSIRLAATLARRFVEQNAQLSFATNGRDSATARAMGLGAGTSAAHLTKIFECLARVSLSFKCPPMADFINEIIDREQAYIFVSPEISEEIFAAFESLRARGVDAHMVVPFFEKPPKNAENQAILAWDATEKSETEVAAHE